MLKGLDELKRETEASKKKVVAAVKKRMVESGMLAVQLAKSKAPHQYGFHAQNIGSEVTNGGMGVRIFANAKYAPYLEFGTGTEVDVPQGFEKMAMEFKGKGIKKINLPARPHIIPAAYRGADYLVEKLNADLSKI